jgi:predicted porin
VSAFAQSSVTIKGTFDPSIGNTKTTYATGPVTSNTAVGNNVQGTSQVTFFGTEDLGGGLKAIFLMENDFSANKNATNNFSSGGGEVYAGLSGRFGSIKLGSPNVPSLDVTGRTPFGTKVGSGFANGSGPTTSLGLDTIGAQGMGHVREDNTVAYESPAFSGLTFKAAVTGKNNPTAAANANPTASSAKQAKQDIGVTYVNGPLKAVLVNYRQDNVYKQTHGYVAYTMGGLTATYGFGSDERLVASSSTAQTATVAGVTAMVAGKSSNNNVALAYATGAYTFMANVGKYDDKSGDNFDKKVSALGVKYDLSKRTSLYARTAKMTYDNVAAAWDKKEVKFTGFGMQHNF